jgi:hypothetical protein
MLLDNHKMYEIVEDHRFSDELGQLRPDPIRRDEFVDGAKWVLSRDPMAGTKIGNKVWFLPTAHGNAVIYYTFDENHVYLQSIQITAEPKADEQ